MVVVISHYPIHFMGFSQALTEALLQVRSDLVETAQKTLEGQARQEIQDANIQQLVDKKTSDLQVITPSTVGELVFQCVLL